MDMDAGQNTFAASEHRLSPIVRNVKTHTSSHTDKCDRIHECDRGTPHDSIPVGCALCIASHGNKMLSAAK